MPVSPVPPPSDPPPIQHGARFTAAGRDGFKQPSNPRPSDEAGAPRKQESQATTSKLSPAVSIYHLALKNRHVRLYRKPDPVHRKQHTRQADKNTAQKNEPHTRVHINTQLLSARKQHKLKQNTPPLFCNKQLHTAGVVKKKHETNLSLGSVRAFPPQNNAHDRPNFEIINTNNLLPTVDVRLDPRDRCFRGWWPAGRSCKVLLQE